MIRTAAPEAGRGWRRTLGLAGVAVVAVIFAIGLGGCTTGAVQSASPPNVVLIVTDDQPAGTVPLMPFLSNAGFTSFDSYYDNNPLCCPTRTTLLTGLYSHHTGIETNLVASRFDDSSTLATWLDASGYETGLYGKYLNEYPWGKPSDYVPPGWDSWAAFAEEGYYDYALVEPGGRTRYGHSGADYSTDVLAQKAASFIEGATDEPFFLYFAPYAPHAPRTPAPRDVGAFEHAPVDLPPNFDRPATPSPRYWTSLPRVSPEEGRELHRAQWATLLSVDDAVARLFDALSATGELDNTIVLYLSDNGYSLGSHRNLQKDCPYEECIRLPLLVRWPGMETDPRVSSLVSSIDIAPTIAEMTGVSVPSQVDGESLVPLLSGRLTTLDRPVLLQHVYYPGTAPSFWGIRTERWMYALYETGERELYDLNRDPYELRNLAGRPSYRDRERKLRADMQELRR